MARIEIGKLCPLLDRDCVAFTCSLYTQVRGTNPQSGKEVDEYACSIAWLPMLLIENTQQVRQVAAATESARNESTRSAESSQKVLLTIAALSTASLTFNKE